MRKWISGIFVACLIIAQLYCQPVRAADLYVSTSGTDSGNCQLSACRTIGYAVGQAVGSDTIHVAAGTYSTETFPIKIFKNLTLTGVGASTTIISNSNNTTDALEIQSYQVNVRNFTIQGGDNGIYLADGATGMISHNIITGGFSQGILVVSASPTIDSNLIYECDDGIQVQDGSNSTISNNTITRNAKKGIRTYDDIEIANNIITYNGSDGIYIYKASPTVKNNTITNNESGIFVEGEYDGSIEECTTWSEVTITRNTIASNTGTGITNTECSRVVATNNLIVYNGHTGISNNAFEDENDITITNNTIVGNGEEGISNTMGTLSTITNNIITSNGGFGIYSDGWSAATSTYNDMWGNLNDNPGNPGTGSISADPLFMSATNLHLQCAVPGGVSPAVDAGKNSAPAIPATDKDGNPRIIGVAVDMGAYETYCFNVVKPPPAQTISNQAIIMAQGNVTKATAITPEATSLLARAKAQGLDTSTCERLIGEAQDLISEAKKVMTNPIYANNLALQAIAKLRQAIDCLKALLG